MHPNVRKLYLLNLLAGTVFWSPVEKLFLLHIGISPFGISINVIVFFIILVTLDVPAGVLADHWKRKYTLQVALVALLIASVIGGVSHNLAEYLPVPIFLGGFIVLTQGTFQAMMYDSLEDTGHQASYDKHQGLTYAAFLVGLGLSSVMGGYMAYAYGFRATYFATAAIMALSFVLACTLTEPKSHKMLADRKLKEHIQSSFRQIVATRFLLQLALLITAVRVLGNAQIEYGGLLFVALGMGAIPMGWSTAGECLFSSLGQTVAPKIGRRALQFAPLFFITFMLFSLIQNRWSLVFFYIAGFLYSVIYNQAEASAQDVIPSEIRATTLSVFSFASNVVLVPLSLVFGWIAQRSVFNAFFVVSVVGLLYLLSWIMSGRKDLQQVFSKQPHASTVSSVEAELI
jgi:MFS family permease